MELNNNEDEADNINRNLLVNNNNNENNRRININRNNNINNNDEEQQNLFLSKYSNFTLSFIIICLMYLFFLFYSHYKDFEENKYVFQIYSIIKHNQYYRFITRYFIHFGFGHLFIELIISIYVLYLFENIFGTISTLFFIIISSIIISLLQTIISLVVYYGLTFKLLNPNNGIELQLANIISWICAVIFAYITNRKYVFESKNNNIIKECTSFFGARIVTLIMDIFIMFLFVTVFKINDNCIFTYTSIIIVLIKIVIII